MTKVMSLERGWREAMKVLLVEDSNTMRAIQKSILINLGYDQIQEACDGLDALGKVASFGPELLLVDWNMPNMDGVSFVKKYREQGGTSPIIMLTTDAEKHRVDQAIKAGVNSCLMKPISQDTLSQRIKETLERYEAA